MSQDTTQPFQPMQTPQEARKKKIDHALPDIMTRMLANESGEIRISWKGSSIQVQFSHYLQLDKG